MENLLDQCILLGVVVSDIKNKAYDSCCRNTTEGHLPRIGGQENFSTLLIPRLSSEEYLETSLMKIEGGLRTHRQRRVEKESNKDQKMEG